MVDSANTTAAGDGVPSVARYDSSARLRKRALREERERRKAHFAEHPEDKLALARPFAIAAVDAVGLTDDPLVIASAVKVAGCPRWLVKSACAIAASTVEARRLAPSLPHPPSFVSPPADPTTGRYRSVWEQRLAAAFDRLGIKYRYEAARFQWTDARGYGHVYTPDFTLVDAPHVHIEVKGKSGADSADNVKMWLAIRQNALTLLLWDAAIIEMVEDMQHASEVMGLFATTRLVA